MHMHTRVAYLLESGEHSLALCRAALLPEVAVIQVSNLTIRALSHRCWRWLITDCVVPASSLLMVICGLLVPRVASIPVSG